MANVFAHTAERHYIRGRLDYSPKNNGQEKLVTYDLINNALYNASVSVK